MTGKFWAFSVRLFQNDSLFLITTARYEKTQAGGQYTLFVICLVTILQVIMNILKEG